MRKLEKIRIQMKERQIDAVLIYDELNQRYLSDFAFTDGYLLITAERALLVTDFRYREMAEKAAAGYEILTPKSDEDVIAQVIADCGVKVIGFEGGVVSYARYHKLVTRYDGVEFVDIGDMVEQLRRVKDAVEISKIQKAQNITDSAFSHLLSVITPDMTEIEVAAELEYAMKKGGADTTAFGTIAVSGPSSSMPHGHPENVKLRRGFLTLDFGACLDGYCSDMTRTIVIGRADADMKRLYDTVLRAQEAALAYLGGGGRNCYTADKCARDIIDADYKGAFGHSLGHGVGLAVHESPALSPRAKDNLLYCGDVVTIEPGIYLAGKYGCRIEDMVAITDAGIHNFTNSPKDLIEIL